MEYFVEMTTHVPAGTPEAEVDDIRAREAARESVPMYGWMNVESTPLIVHPNDPVNGTKS